MPFYRAIINPHTGKLTVVLGSEHVVKNLDNIFVNAFHIAINGALSIFNMVDGFVDEYEDATGVDATSSLNESYDATNNLYKSTGGVTVPTAFAHYKCNDDAENTTVTDDGTGANNGIASDGTGTTNTSNLSIVGKINKAFDFAGSPVESIDVSALSADIETDTSGSICMWVNPDVISGSQYLFSLNDTSSNQDYFFFFINSSGQLQASIVAVGSTLVEANTTTILSVGTWYHIAVVQDGTELKIYINGVSDTLNFTTSVDKGAWFGDMSAANIDNGRIACRDYNGLNPSQQFNGKIEDFRYYQNDALIVDEISALYNEDNGTEAQNPVDAPDNMTLISETQTAASQPATARLILLEEDVNEITLNTDILGYASRDGGSTWAEITLSKQIDFDSTRQVLAGNADFSSMASGTSMRYKVVTANNKSLLIHGASLSWS
jgi:hypothetical protein